MEVIMFHTEEKIKLEKALLQEAEDETVVSTDFGYTELFTIFKIFVSEGNKLRWRTYYDYVFTILESDNTESFWSTVYEVGNDEYCDADGYINSKDGNLVELRRVHPKKIETTIYV